MIIFVFIIGTAIGSFINVLESRLYKGENFLTLPSHCDFCHKKLKWRDMIPILSWLWYSGRSRCCKKRLSWQYPVVELTSGVGFVAIYLRENIASLLHCFIAFQANFVCFGTDSVRSLQKIFDNGMWNNVILFIFYVFVFILCLTIFLQDLKYQAIHERLLQLLIAITLIFNFKFLIFNANFQIVIALLCALPFYLLYKLSKERWLGEGDVWLAAWMGLFLGFPKVFWAMYVGLIFGGMASLIIVLLKLKKMRDTISLGPFLLIGTLVSLFIK